ILHVARPVASLAVDDDLVSAPARERIRDGRVRSEIFALMVEDDESESGSEAKTAAAARQIAGQHAEQGRLAGAVGPDETDPVAAQNAHGEIRYHGRAAERFI